MANLPIRELILYKSGIGYFVRAGEYSGDTLTMTFDQDEINDVLKSLNVVDQSGGQVIGIHYDTPTTAADRLANNSLRLTATESLHSLLRDLRGRSVKLTFERRGQTETVEGQVVGLDVKENVTWVSVLQSDGHLRVHRLDHLRDLLITDAEANTDLTDFLANNQSESERRTVRVQLSDGDHNLHITYVAPSPNWRVSYRVIADTDDAEASGEALLLGWGLFDNRIEDLDNVYVTLVAGSPISFQYDLYSSNIPERQRVQDTGTHSQGPVSYDAAPPPMPQQPSAQDELRTRMLSSVDMAMSDPELRMSFADRVVMPVSRAFNNAFNDARANRQIENRLARVSDRKEANVLRGVGVGQVESLSSEQAAGSFGSNTTGRESGEVFQYEVTQPVSVKKGVSALVPIINHGGIGFQRELLYNSAKVPNHPVAALRLKNETGLTLETGPVTVVENGDYKGEAVVPFTRDGAELYLPFAVERGVVINEINKPSFKEAGRYIKDLEMVEEKHHRLKTMYAITNNTNKPKTIRIEAAKQKDFDLYESPEPEEETESFRRWTVTVEANHRFEFVVKTRKIVEHKEIMAAGCNPLARLLAWGMNRVHGIRIVR